MKIINQIIITVILAIIIFIVKTDYDLLYSNTISYIKSGIGKSVYIYNTEYKDKVGGVMDTISKSTANLLDDNTKTVNSIGTPGALVVPDDLLTYNTKSINLTSNGVVDITNKYRESDGGLPPLTENSKLNFSAEKKLQDMFVKGYFEHMSPDGVGVGDLGNQVSYEYILIGENLALGNFKDDQSLVDAWMASPGHKANILNKRYTEIGVAVSKGIYNGKSVWMSVQHFGLPKSACPSIDEVLRGIISIDQEKVQKTEVELSSIKKQIDTGSVYEGVTTSGLIEIYNSLVNDYNKMIIDIKEKINKYNQEVRDFNTCIEGVN